MWVGFLGFKEEVGGEERLLLFYLYWSLTCVGLLDLPGLDTAAIASAYGLTSTRVSSADELEAALGRAIEADGPQLVEVGIAPGMWLF